MDKEKKIEVLKYLMTRFDGLINVVNTKANFYFVVNTFLITTCVTGYLNWAATLELNGFYKVSLLVCVIVSILSIITIGLAVSPILKTGNGKDYKSLLFFGSISQMKESEFVKTINDVDIDTLIHDFTIQLYTLSELLNTKYSLLKKVGWVITAEFLLLGILIVSKLITFKN